jgi:GPH family glycoside/pentoside/hexuronide:cation symporter
MADPASPDNLTEAAVAAKAGEGSLPWNLKLKWATGALGVALLMNGVSALALFYLTVVVRLEPALAGFLIFVTKIYDAVSDPFSGWLSDRTKSKKGRRRPFLLWGAIVSGPAFLLVFTVPWTGPFDSVTSGPGLYAVIWVLLTLILYTTGYSLFNVPYMAMPTEMTKSYHERSSIHGFRVVFAAAGALVVQALAGVLLQRYGKDWDAHAMVGLVGGVVITATMLVSYFGTARAPAYPASTVKLPMREQVRGFMRNRSFQLVLGVKLAQLIGIAAASGGLVFFLAQVLGRPLTLLPVIGAATTLAVFTMTPILVALSKRIGKRAGYMLSAIVTGLTSLSWVLATPDEPVWSLALRGFFLGVAFAGNVLFAMSMLADSMEADTHDTGLRREGMYSAFYSFVEKLAASIGPLILGGALSYAGFNPQSPPEQVTEAVRQAVLIGIAYVPAAMSLVAVSLLYFYRLDEETLMAMRKRSAAADEA